MNSKSIYQCFNCDQLYCAECSSAGSPTDYCSDKCQIEQTALNEPKEEPLIFKLSGLKKPHKKILRGKINMNDEIIEEQWFCPFCGNDELWFDRTITFLPDGSEIGMQDRCTQCGKSVDELPEEEVSEEVVDIVIETTEEPSDSDLREESY